MPPDPARSTSAPTLRQQPYRYATLDERLLPSNSTEELFAPALCLLLRRRPNHLEQVKVGKADGLPTGVGQSELFVPFREWIAPKTPGSSTLTFAK